MLTVGNKLSDKGNSGDVFQARWEGQEVVVKRTSKYLLRAAQEEWQIYKTLQATQQSRVGFARAFHACISDEGEFDLVMTRLGDDVDTIHAAQGRRMSLKSVLMLGDQLLQRLATFHSATAYKHNSLKGPNVMMGTGRKGQYIAHLIDFGTSTRVADTAAYREKATTSWYRSWHHASAMDDVFSLGLNMVFWLTGFVPFADSNLDKETALSRSTGMSVYDCRVDLRVRDELALANISEWELPPRLLALLQYARTSTDPVPHYACLRRILRACAEEHRLVLDGDFDWVDRGPCKDYECIVGAPLHRRDACGCGCIVRAADAACA